MIRINLLGEGKTKKGKRSGGVSLSAIGNLGGGEGPSVIVMVLVVALLAAGANGFWYWKLKRDGDKIKVELANKERELARLQQVKVKYLEREKQRNDYKKRVDIIDKLRAEQSGPVNLLAMLGTTVSHSDAVWLNTMYDEGGQIKLDGVALSVHAVADLMRNLQNTGYFRSVELQSTYQDEGVRDMQAFVFTLVCQKQAKS